MKVKYNDNITLLVDEDSKLAKNEFYVLMVADIHRGNKDNRKFFDFQKGWLGLERTSEQQIYISRKKANKSSLGRGVTMKAVIKDPSQCCELDY